MTLHMNKILVYILGVMLLGACVDDYTDANPPHQLDAPTLRISSSVSGQKIETIPANAYQNTYRAYTEYGTPVEFTVSVIDAPGRVASVSVVPSVAEYGTVTLNDATVSSITGQEKGEFKFTFTPNPALPDVSDRAMNLVVTVADGQLDQVGESLPKTTILTVPTTLVACVSEGIEEGTWMVTQATANEDGGLAITLDSLQKYGGDQILVEITAERPGLYTIDEATGGVWPIYYAGRISPIVQVDLCGNTIVGHDGTLSFGEAPNPVRAFTVDGTLNGDGTITITWSYERVGAATPADPAKGTYTLTKL